MENDQNPFQVHTNSCTMEIDQSQLAADKDTSHKAKSNCGREELDQLVQRVQETAKHCTEEQIYNVLRDCNMDPNQAAMRLLLVQSQGPSPLERYGHEGPSTVLFDLSPLKSVRPEHEGSSSYFEGLPDESPAIRTFFDELNAFKPYEPLQIQSDTAHQQVNEIIPERREEEKKKQKDSIEERDQLVQRVKEIIVKHWEEQNNYNHLRDCNMDPNQAVELLLLGQSQGPSSIESVRYGHEGPSRVFECLSPLESQRAEHEGSSSRFKDTAHQQVNHIIHERREEKETKKSQEWKRLYEQSQKWKLDEEVVKQISKNVMPGAGFDPNGENNDRE